MSGLSDKVIKRICEAKIKRFIDSIDDLNLRKLVEKDVFLTGGSIASMMIGERVNDYDLYFKTKTTVVELAKYYLKQHLQSNNDISVKQHLQSNNAVSVKQHLQSNNDISVKQYEDFYKRYPEATVEIQTFDNMPERVCVYISSSGYIDNSGNDEITLDEYMGESEGLSENNHVDNEEDKNKEFTVKFITSNSISLFGGIQIITRFTGSPDEIHSNFDFVHAKAVYDYDKKSLIYNTETLRSLQTKRLVYRGSKYPVCSLFRIRKFIKRGWNINAGEILKIALQISQLDLMDIKVLEDQLVGVDYTFMLQFIRAVKDLDEHKMCDNLYLGEVIDRIFND